MTKGPASGRSLFAVLFDRTYGPFLAARILSSSGTWIQNIAAAVLMFEVTRSAVMVGMVSMLQFLPPMLFTLLTGALTDRFDRRRILLVGRVLSGGAIGLLGLVIAIRGIDGFGGPPALLAAVFVTGVGFSLSGPAMHALIPSLVPAEDLDHALALSSTAPGVARTAGPAIGGLLLLAGGPAAAFLVAASFHFSYAIVLLFIRARSYERETGRPDILGGVRYLWQDRKAGALMIGIALLGFGADPVITLTPSLAVERGAGTEVVGLLASAFGVGALTSIPIYNGIRKLTNLRVSGVLGFLALGAGLLVVAISGTLAGAVVGFFIAGMGLIVGQVSLTTRIQRRIPERLRGRVMALWTLAWLGSRPIAAMLNGSIADNLSIELALYSSAAIVLLASLLARVRYSPALDS